MARPRPTTQDSWTQEGLEAILDLVNERQVAPWPEVESRIAHGPWKDYWPAQPLQLNGARQILRQEDPLRVVEETSGHTTHAVTTLRIPFNGNKRDIERLRGAKRKRFRRYLKWTGDQKLCGKHAEQVVLDSIAAAQTDAALWVPQQKIGEVAVVDDVEIKPGPLDAVAFILNPDTVQREGVLLVEVKNLRPWVYPWAPELWEMLVKAARLSIEVENTPVLMAPHIAWTTFQLAKDVGFMTCPYRTQFFSPAIDETDFGSIRDEFGLTITQHEGPSDEIVNWIKRFLRDGPSSVHLEFDEWWSQQANRLALTAPLILEHEGLAGNLVGDDRAATFRRFKVRLSEVAQWDLEGGY